LHGTPGRWGQRLAVGFQAASPRPTLAAIVGGTSAMVKATIDPREIALPARGGADDKPADTGAAFPSGLLLGWGAGAA